MGSVQAKVRCIGNESPAWDVGGTSHSRTVRFTPVYDADPGSRNFEWSQATPAGYLELTITNPDAFDRFQVGEEYRLTFESA